ncbi:protein of unknown function (plasmid) [Cupriavidus taiwanensis]|nr:protein of unknown function [Cupriavidus taiwanensis]
MLAAFRLSETGGRDAQARDHHDDDARTRSAQGDSGRGRPWPGGLARREKLGLSRRQVERLVLRYREDGPSGLGSRKRGRDSNRQLPSGLESRVRGLIRGSYADFGPTLAAEKLRERHGIDLATETVRRIMIDAGFWSRSSALTTRSSGTVAAA